MAASDRGLALLAFRDQDLPRLRDVEYVESEVHLELYVRQLREYLARERQTFDLPLDLRGTDFQKRCWQALLAIPYGKTKSYAEIAQQVGSPAAFRAVGQANHHNPVAIIVPCHRVLASGRKLGGYGGGLPMKKWLLELEGVLSLSLEA